MAFHHFRRLAAPRRQPVADGGAGADGPGFQPVDRYPLEIGQFLAKTHLPEQIKAVDFPGLFANPWFLVPFIALTGYLLYYAGSETFRQQVSWMHLILGLCLPAVLALHVLLGKRAARH